MPCHGRVWWDDLRLCRLTRPRSTTLHSAQHVSPQKRSAWGYMLDAFATSAQFRIPELPALGVDVCTCGCQLIGSADHRRSMGSVDPKEELTDQYTSSLHTSSCTMRSILHDSRLMSSTESLIAFPSDDSFHSSHQPSMQHQHQKD